MFHFLPLLSIVYSNNEYYRPCWPECFNLVLRIPKTVFVFASLTIRIMACNGLLKYPIFPLRLTHVNAFLAIGINCKVFFVVVIDITTLEERFRLTHIVQSRIVLQRSGRPFHLCL